jgi:hypothetical protein
VGNPLWVTISGRLHGRSLRRLRTCVCGMGNTPLGKKTDIAYAIG